MMWLGLLLSAAVLAQEAPKPAAIEGRVVNAKTGEPLRRAHVTLTPLGSGPPRASAATTDSEGKFRIGSLEAGPHRLAAERLGYLDQIYGAPPAGTTGTLLRLEAGQELKSLDIRMMPQSVVTGRVLDDEGEPLARVGIRLLREQYVEGKRRMMQVGAGSTLDTGEFRLAGVRPGRYWISARYVGPTAMGSAEPAEDYLGTFYPGVAGLPSALPLDIAAGQELRGIDIPMVRARVYRVTGRVEGGSLDLHVLLLPREGAMGDPLPSLLPEEKGAFEFAGVPPGAYTVMAVSTVGSSLMVGSTPVDVAGDDVGNVVVLLSSASTVRGTFRIEGDAAEKPPLDRISIILVASSPNPFGTGRSTFFKQDGSFLIEGIIPDRYRVIVSGLPLGYWLDSARMGDRDVLNEGLDLTSGAAVSLAVTVRAGTGSVSGAVTDSRQQPTAAFVALVPEPFLENRFDLRPVSNTDQYGRFNIGNVPPGSYRLYAWEGVESEQLADPHFLKAFESKAEKIEIEPNGRHQVTVKVIPAETVTYHSQGTPE